MKKPHFTFTQTHAYLGLPQYDVRVDGVLIGWVRRTTGLIRGQFWVNSRHTGEQPTRKMAAEALHSGFTLIELLIVMAIIGILVALTLPAVMSSREAGRRLACQNNQRQIGLAMAHYVEHNGHYPSGAAMDRLVWAGDGTPTGTREGWRVYLLPYLEEQNIYGKYDQDASVCEGVDSELSALLLPVYICPSDGKQPLDPHREDYYRWRTANYVGSMGVGDKVRLESSHCGSYATDGLLYPNSRIKSAHVTDGDSNTLLVGEQVNWLRVWTAGAYWTGSPRQHVCVFPTKNVTHPINSDPQDLCYKDCIGPRTCLFNDVFFSSRHPGGVNFLYADGHVEFVSDGIELETLQALATRAGGEVP